MQFGTCHLKGRPLQAISIVSDRSHRTDIMGVYNKSISSSLVKDFHVRRTRRTQEHPFRRHSASKRIYEGLSESVAMRRMSNLPEVGLTSNVPKFEGNVPFLDLPEIIRNRRDHLFAELAVGDDIDE
jgi:hypothetical protein